MPVCLYACVSVCLCVCVSARVSWWLQDAKEMGHDNDIDEMPSARLACQIELTKELDGLLVVLPESMHNILEIPLWLRNR